MLWPAGINKDFSVSGLFMEYTFFYWFSSQVLISLLPTCLSFLPVLYHQATETLRPCVSVIKGASSVEREMKVLHMGEGEVPACGPFLLTSQLLEIEWAPITCSVALRRTHAQSAAHKRLTPCFQADQFRPVQASISLILGVKCWHRDDGILSFVCSPVLVHPAFSFYSSLLQNMGRFNAIVKSLAKSTNEPNAQKPPAELSVWCRGDDGTNSPK